MRTRPCIQFFVITLTVVLALQAFSVCAVAEGEFPVTNESGFLVSGEFAYENPEAGVWRYLSPTLRIEIIRHEDAEKGLVWTEADIRTQGGEHFRMTPKNAEKRMERMDYVPDIAKENGVVFATTSDFAHLRIEQNNSPGIIIRDGEIISTKVQKKRLYFPNLDTLALFDDGDMKVFAFKEHTAEEYLAMGAADVLSFGPVLVRDGMLDEAAKRSFGQYREPRVAIGMVEKGHYISIMVEGRHDQSKGVTTEELAQLFLDKGCVLAFNLDGGQSATMSFMGKQIIRVGNRKSPDAPARSTAELFGIGYSASLLEKESE